MAQALDRERAQEFTGTLLGFYRGAMLTFMVDIGSRTGLFEAAAQGPATSQELADRAGLHERYVREWLGAMTVGGVFTYEPTTRTYTLPPEHAAGLTGPAGSWLAASSRRMAMLGARLPKVAHCFQHGGGVPYSEYEPDFTEFGDVGSRMRHDLYLLHGYLPAVRGLPERLEQGIAVADIGCGTGHAVNLMAQRYPASRFVGYDIGEAGIARARAEATAMELVNARFEVLDVARLPTEPKLDLITAFDAIHDQVAPATVLRRVCDALAPDGVFLMLDFTASSNLEDNIAVPDRAFTYGSSVLHCMTVSLAEGGAGLGSMWGEQLARRMLAEAGFTSVEVVPAPDGRNSVYTCRK